MRKLLRVDLLIIDDFALQALDALDTADIYELIVERHRAAATVVTSNREPIEWLGLMADPLLAQSAIDRLQSAAHELVLDGESYRQRQKPGHHRTDDTLDRPPTDPAIITTPTLTPRAGPMSLAHGWSHRAGARHSTRPRQLSQDEWDALPPNRCAAVPAAANALACAGPRWCH